MELHRFAVISLTNPAPVRVLMLRYSSTLGIQVTVDEVQGAEAAYEASDSSASGGLKVQWPDASGQPALLFVQSWASGLPPEFDPSGRVIVPDEDRRRTEAAIEEFADVLAVAHQCRRTIRSPQTCVALVPESAGEFGTATGLSYELGPRQSGARLLPELCADKVPAAIAGRPEGLRLLASALSEEGSGGRAREYYRLIEAAFGEGIGTLKKPLHEFLKTTPHAMNFTKKETDRWVAMRGATMHGDRYIAPNAAIAPYLDRLQWAAYDLVLHKENWGMKDSDRRPGIPILSGPTADGSVVIFYPSATVPVEFMDPFGVYVIDRRVQANPGGPGILTNLPRVQHPEA